MSCMPKSGGCEWKHIAPFIARLNRLEGTSFHRDVCLDRKSRNRPEPEVRCTQVNDGVPLVVERKCVVWPKDYAAKHDLDHQIADDLFNNLSSLVGDSPYAVHLEPGFDGTKDQARAFAAEIVGQVRCHFSELDNDKELNGDFTGHQWAFYRDPDFERRGHNRPGLVVRCDLPLNPEIYTNPPAALFDEIKRLVNSAAKKFQNYLDHRRSLLITAEGEVPCLAEWWGEVFENRVSVPTEVSDIWLACDESDGSDEIGWLFEKVWPQGNRCGGNAG